MRNLSSRGIVIIHKHYFVGCSTTLFLFTLVLAARCGTTASFERDSESNTEVLNQHSWCGYDVEWSGPRNIRNWHVPSTTTNTQSTFTTHYTDLIHRSDNRWPSIDSNWWERMETVKSRRYYGAVPSPFALTKDIVGSEGCLQVYGTWDHFIYPCLDFTVQIMASHKSKQQRHFDASFKCDSFCFWLKLRCCRYAISGGASNRIQFGQQSIL